MMAETTTAATPSQKSSSKNDDPRSLNLLPTPSLSQQQRVDNNNNTINSAETSSLSEQLRPTTKPTTDHSFPDVYIFEPKLWVPENQTVNEQLLLSNEFNKSDSTRQLTEILMECGASEVHILPTTLPSHADTIRELVVKWMREGRNLCVFNLCDGTETDGYPGLSIVSALQRSNLPYTGADVNFYDGTTSKPHLKRKLQEKGVPTSSFVEIRQGCEEEDIIKAEGIVGYPMIVKPSVSYASLSISDKSVVKTREDAIKQCKAVMQNTSDGVFLEQFLPGREFTVLCVGDNDIGVHVYMAAERVFNKKLGQYERLLAFDRYWQGYDMQGGRPPAEMEQLYWYAPGPAEWQDKLKDLAKSAYIACGGSGYGRVDIRTKSLNEPDALVLEVNANCGLSFGKGSSSLGEILEMSNVSPKEFCKELIYYALERQRRRGGSSRMMGAKPRSFALP